MVKKRLNVKLLLILAGALLVGGAAVPGLHLVMMQRHAHTCSPRPTPATSLKKPPSTSTIGG